MTNEEFQRIVLEELKGLKEEQREIKKEMKAITEQTALLTEFRKEVNSKLDTIVEENDIFKEIIGKHEVDIRRIQRRIV